MCSVSSHVTGYHWKEPDSDIFVPFLHWFLSIDEILLNLLFPGWTILVFSSLERCSSLFVISVVLCWKGDVSPLLSPVEATPEVVSPSGLPSKRERWMYWREPSKPENNFCPLCLYFNLYFRRNTTDGLITCGAEFLSEMQVQALRISPWIFQYECCFDCVYFGI